MKRLVTILAIFAMMLAENTASANNIASSIMYFEGNLTDNGDGTYSGVVAMIDEGGGDSGYDIYGKEGATAWFGDDPVLSPKHVPRCAPGIPGSCSTDDSYEYFVFFH